MDLRTTTLHFILQWGLLFYLVFYFQPMLISNQNINPTPCNSTDVSALQAFVTSLPYSTIKGWSSNSSSVKNTACCNWTGISCDNSTGRVIGVDLQLMNLPGNISPSLVQLDQLRWLNLSYNRFEGSIPNQLLYLPNLERFDVSNNFLRGTIPIFNGSSSLEIFDISYNNFYGPLNPSICNYSSNIKILRYSKNLFRGDFPIGFSNCRSLEEIRLDSNIIMGSIAVDLFKLSNLKKLYLQDNQLSGEMSKMFSNLSNLIELDISDNLFQGKIPDIFGTLQKLKTFSANSNDFTGLLPSSLVNLASLRILLLRNNSLSGQIDLNCSAMTQLSLLDLESNLFTGPINALNDCLTLRTINLARNNLTGEIPSNFRNLKLLSYISLAENNFYNFSLALSILGDLPSLTTLVLIRNFFGGEHMPSSILGFQNVETLIIANCAFSGAIPPWIANLAKLKVLDLSWNLFTGTIPPQIANLDSLIYLDLSNNALSGDIPSSLTNLKGLISKNIVQQWADEADYFPFFTLSNITGNTRRYNPINHPFLPSLILRNNLLTGPILSGFGILKYLLVLDLGINQLSGAIPEELSGMSNLEVLDLSHNDLSGGIPDSLSYLNFLSIFSVQYNNLTGKIPRGGQFDTLSCSSYEGNPNLYGYPCNPYNKSTPSEFLTDQMQGKKDGLIPDFTAGAIVGMSAGVFIGIGIGALIPLGGRFSTRCSFVGFLYNFLPRNSVSDA